jgi:hypothetical protein
LLEQSEIKPDIRWADLPAKEQNKLIKNLCAQEFAVKGKTTFKEEFVTAGGIKLDEIDVNSMQSKLHPGIIFCRRSNKCRRRNRRLQLSECMDNGMDSCKCDSEGILELRLQI